jgi:hypothetical protein
MKYHSMMFAGALAFSGLASAAGNDNSTASKDEMTDYQIECLEAALAEEDQPQGALKDAFIQDCVQKKLAIKTKPKDKNT